MAREDVRAGRRSSSCSGGSGERCLRNLIVAVYVGFVGTENEGGVRWKRVSRASFERERARRCSFCKGAVTVCGDGERTDVVGEGGWSVDCKEGKEER
jgi:hypothetical protein